MKIDVRLSRLLLYLVSILIALTLTLILIVMVMRPPVGDLLYLALLMALTAAGSAGIGYLSHRLGWWRRFRSINLALTLGYLFAAGLSIFNVWLTAELMFINQHDLALGTLLLLFAAGISVSFGYFLSSSITQTLHDLAHAAEKVSRGDYTVQVPVNGKDEVSRLAQTFNEMAAQLDAAAAAEKALDEARRNLVAGASHDLRTPLTSMRAMLDALAEGVVTDPATVARYLRQCQIEITRMSGLLDDLFEMTRLDIGHYELYREPNSLLDLISDTLEGFSARAREKDLRLTGSVAPDVDPVWMDAEKISRVLDNLIANALRYTPPEGEIQVLGLRAGDLVWVTVRDTGPGIPAEEVPRVFDRFYRGERSRARDPAGRGAGLGLAIAKGIVEAHGGEIVAESVLGGGTTIRFSLPKDAPHA